MSNFGNVYTGDTAKYYINATQTVHESGLSIDRTSALGLKVEAYLAENPDKAFDSWTDSLHEHALILARVKELEDYLFSTDYCVIKCQERGLDMQTEYPVEYVKRQAARDEINELRNQLT